MAVLWCGLLGVLVWDKSAWLAIAIWLVMGLVAAAISGRYDTTKTP